MLLKPKNGKQKADPRSQSKVVERLQMYVGHGYICASHALLFTAALPLTFSALRRALASAFSSGPPSSIKVPLRASKRKPALSEPGSDIEILDGPVSPSPTKKKRALPSRGTPFLQVPEHKATVASHLKQLGGPAAGTRDDSASAAASKEKSETPPADAAVRPTTLVNALPDDDSETTFQTSPHKLFLLFWPCACIYLTMKKKAVSLLGPHLAIFIDTEARKPNDAASDVEEGSEAASADESSDAHSQAAANASAPGEDAH
ncbi:hypothetical protein LshimejAT787_0500060 [Lyophyllum shimeji]|uniref:Uncharacterized protein n=1 Tax=Lyophyllum shimeji TaxID=47721 RepID=A0A9P3UPB7_LYOSH|nr:hypothetical protein LshimejAT787_0500060 [Lyophyllum shimeji]